MDGLVTVEEAATLTGYGRRTIDRWIADGKLDPRKVRGRRETFVAADELMVAVRDAPRRPRRRSKADT